MLATSARALLVGAAAVLVLVGCTARGTEPSPSAAAPETSAPASSAPATETPSPSATPTPEPVLLDAAADGPAFVRAWAEAGFPSDATDPARFCPGWTIDDPATLEWLPTTPSFGWTANVPDAVDPATSEVLLEMRGEPDTGSAADYLVGVGGSGTPALCIASIRLSS